MKCLNVTLYVPPIAVLFHLDLHGIKPFETSLIAQKEKENNNVWSIENIFENH